MDLRQLRTFVTVAELGTVSRAAQRMHVAQPALSRQIRALEDELGVALFDRLAGRLHLSSAGARLLGECKGLLNYARELGEHAQLMRRPDAGVLRVAASPHYVEGVFPALLKRYAQRFPEVQVKVVDIAGPATIGMLERGEIHLAQGTGRLLTPGQQHIATRPLESVHMLAAFSPGLPIGKGNSVEIASLAPYPLLQTGQEYVIRRTFDAACRLAGFEPNVALEGRSPHGLLAMAEAGHGVAIIPSALRTHAYRLRIAYVTYRRRALTEPLHILYDRRRPQAPYVTAFCDMLAEHVRRISPMTRPVDPGRRARVAR
jgi:LysR family nitrogen assimilation transcriptional regulator